MAPGHRLHRYQAWTARSCEHAVQDRNPRTCAVVAGRAVELYNRCWPLQDLLESLEELRVLERILLDLRTEP